MTRPFRRNHKFWASWICRICKETSNLYNVVNSYCSRYGVNIEYLVKLSERNDVNFEIISCLPSFYREILCCFNNCKKSLNTVNLSNAEFIQQPLWNNEMFKYNGKTIFFKRWSQSNILLIMWKTFLMNMEISVLYSNYLAFWMIKPIGYVNTKSWRVYLKLVRTPLNNLLRGF